MVFCYDLECSLRISPEDFENIEAEMNKEIKAKNTFEKLAVAREQAVADAQSGRLGGLGERPGNASKFKLDLLNQLPEGEPISYFKNGDFFDLCAGPHVMRTPSSPFVPRFERTSCLDWTATRALPIPACGKPPKMIGAAAMMVRG